MCIVFFLPIRHPPHTPHTQVIDLAHFSPSEGVDENFVEGLRQVTSAIQELVPAAVPAAKKAAAAKEEEAAAAAAAAPAEEE